MKMTGSNFWYSWYIQAGQKQKTKKVRGRSVKFKGNYERSLTFMCRTVLKLMFNKKIIFIQKYSNKAKNIV